MELAYSPTSPIFDLVAERPTLWTRFEEMIAWEDGHGEWRDQWDGWESWQVHTAKRICTQLVDAGFLDQHYHSRSADNFRLANRQATREALEMLRDVTNQQPPTGNTTPDHASGLFRYVYGLDGVKTALLGALAAEKPVHVLLVGPPGSAKSTMIGDIGSLPKAEFYAASQTTRSGLVGLLIDKRPRYLVLDEIDKCRQEETTPLLTLMEKGTVEILHHRNRQKQSMVCSVFAAANSDRGISPALLSRFVVLQIPGYTREEFMEISQRVLIEKDAIGPGLAKFVAERIVEYTLDVRQARALAQMVKNCNPHALMTTTNTILRAMFSQARVSTLKPVYPERGER